MNSTSAFCRNTALILACLAGLSGCASLTVTRVTDDNDREVKGVRYYLPKPYLQATPQADGTVSLEVIFLPDKSRQYAIDSSAHLSSYTFQVVRDEKGLLTALEYKSSTAAVGQQLASSLGGSAVQGYNIKAAQLVALQNQVSAAQTALDSARATRAAAEATLESDLAHGASSSTVTSDYAALAQAKAKEQVAEQTLQRAQTTNLAVSTSVVASTPISTSAPAIATPFSPPTWGPATVYSLPSEYPPVLYSVNDTGSAVQLVAVRSELPGTTLGAGSELQRGVIAQAQRKFATTAAALPPPTLSPAEQTVALGAGQAVFHFNRPVKPPLTLGSTVTSAAVPPVVTSVLPKLSADGKTVSIDLTGLTPGSYLVTAKFSFQIDSRGHVRAGTQQVKLVLTP